ncbi:hypothetical protein [Bacillus sp. FDAARGOS_1420]|uniref:hypothetical protein n=1 Tax=unclassified Bacillus (in: firmicutes) TaxID=185979 RepID=UPI001C5AEA92|nr:hypothetical protein [Bacillus sp. FDAARGOS_1420]MBW3496823.1 hypothetical protein [Bacillus sp. FDAARGOS_1420]
MGDGERWFYLSPDNGIKNSKSKSFAEGPMAKGTKLTLHEQEKMGEKTGPLAGYKFDKDGVWVK